MATGRPLSQGPASPWWVGGGGGERPLWVREAVSTEPLCAGDVWCRVMEEMGQVRGCEQSDFFSFPLFQ
jgi:hypothetical protein